jgi:Protein of unknown function (DUF3551)
MKASLFILGLIAATAALGSSAQAQDYPWCAQYGSGMGGGGRNCGFTTFQQCQEDVSGIGGFCEQNNTYRAPTASHRHHHIQP